MFFHTCEHEARIKSDEVAVEKREEGNVWFKKKNFIIALDFYNQSIGK